MRRVGISLTSIVGIAKKSLQYIIKRLITLSGNKERIERVTNEHVTGRAMAVFEDIQERVKMNYVAIGLFILVLINLLSFGFLVVFSVGVWGYLVGAVLMANTAFFGIFLSVELREAGFWIVDDYDYQWDVVR